MDTAVLAKIYKKMTILDTERNIRTSIYLCNYFPPSLSFESLVL